MRGDSSSTVLSASTEDMVRFKDRSVATGGPSSFSVGGSFPPSSFVIRITIVGLYRNFIPSPFVGRTSARRANYSTKRTKPNNKKKKGDVSVRCRREVFVLAISRFSDVKTPSLRACFTWSEAIDPYPKVAGNTLTAETVTSSRFVKFVTLCESGRSAGFGVWRGSALNPESCGQRPGPANQRSGELRRSPYSDRVDRCTQTLVFKHLAICHHFWRRQVFRNRVRNQSLRTWHRHRLWNSSGRGFPYSGSLAAPRRSSSHSPVALKARRSLKP